MLIRVVPSPSVAPAAAKLATAAESDPAAVATMEEGGDEDTAMEEGEAQPMQLAVAEVLNSSNSGSAA